MKKFIVYTFLLLLIFMACVAPEGIANDVSQEPNGNNGQSEEGIDNGQNGLAKIKTYLLEYVTVDGDEESLSSKWDGNILYSYNPDASISSQSTYDDKGRVTSLLSGTSQYQYRYVGDGSGIGESNYSQAYLTVDDAEEYLIEKWDGNILYVYNPDASISSQQTYDDKGRVTSLLSGTSQYQYRYVGDGSGIGWSNYSQLYVTVDGDEEYLSNKWDGNILYSYNKDASISSQSTYDDKGRVTSSFIPSSSNTFRTYQYQYRYVD